MEVFYLAIKYYKLLDMLQRQEISKGQFAQMTGLSSATVAKLSSHKPVNIEIIDRICKTFECQPGDIMEYVDTKAEVVSEILQHVNRIQQDPAFRDECRKNQAQEIADMDKKESSTN